MHIHANTLTQRNMSCGAPHHYPNINDRKIKQIIEVLTKNGAVISGENPWKVDTNNFGVKLVGTWEVDSSSLTVEVTDKSFFVPCDKIWENLDTMIYKIANSDLA